MDWFRPVGDKLLEMARIQEGFLVLDVATGSGEPGENLSFLQMAQRLGADGAIEKPFRVQDLQKMVRNLQDARPSVA